MEQTTPFELDDQPRRFCLDCGYPLDGLRDSRCPECGRLFDPSDPDTYVVNVGSLVKLFTGGDSWEAHVMRGLLEQQGIRAHVFGDALGMARGELPLTYSTLPSVWVGEHDAEHAMEVVEDYERIRREGPPANTAAAWTCSGCGEQLDGQFSECWNCGASRPEPVEDDPPATV